MSETRDIERRLYQQVADRIRTLVQEKRIAPGCRLPAERELAQQLGVSRPSLREAMIALEIEGTVEIRMGSGIYVTEAPTERGARPTATGESPVDLMQARFAIEGTTVMLAAMRLTPERLGELRRTLSAMRRTADAGGEPIEHDRRFHMILAEDTGNGVLARLVAELFDERHNPIFARVRSRFEPSTTWAMVATEHEAILTALEDRNALLAQSMMQAHLEQSKRRWLDNDPR
ncbi:FadR/GntR family transcriptional regulator [Aureimonas psammosilenae]|uniref:FadR/GntR family transcriptional regulator n=1 Tax=Aureimonas psammosilenae TaxID=2495496 RepID=UPI00126098F7|nr:FadR/GntR family transcriptional regulator [Aureimonas psammosilenae]